MRLIGASASEVDAVIDALAGCALQSLPCFVWCDGDDVTAVVGEAGDTIDEVQKLALAILVGPAS